VHAQSEHTVPLERAVRLQPGVSCLEEDRLIDNIATWLGSREIDERVSIEVAGDSRFARFVAFRIARGSESLAERRFEPGPARCEDLHAALGLAIALACKASVLDGVLARSAAGGGGLARDSSTWRLGLDALGGAAVLPGAVVGSSLWLQAEVGRGWSVKLGVSGFSGFDRDFVGANGSFGAWLGSARLDLCGTLGAFGRARLAACAGISGGGIVVRGRDLRSSETEVTRYLALANGLDLAVALATSWSLHGAVSLVTPLSRSEFVVRDGSGEVVSSDALAAVGGYIALGIAHAL
jgi:hypothetical protein